jgi:hypothetical protein
VLVADAVAITGIVSGWLVAIAVALINARKEQRRMEIQSRDARLSELRDLLDDAVEHLYNGYWTLYFIRQESAKDPRGPEWSPERLYQLGDELRAEVKLLPPLGLRVKLRTPAGAGVGERQDKANHILLNYEWRYRKYLEADLADKEKPPSAPADETFEAITVLIREIRDFVGVVEPGAVAPQSEVLRAMRSFPDRLRRSDDRPAP